ncbi:MAG: iron-sulfur cluster assembly protein [Promethearchaeota archaeon]
MDTNISEEDVRNVLAWVNHPMIDRSLLELGIIKHIAVEQGKVNVTLAFPFPNIPIKDHIIHSVREPIQKLGAEIEVKLTVMNHDELQKFLAMEQDAWKGG